MSERVSFGLPVYNGESFIAEAIQSLLDQDFQDFELVITDNASTDRTAEICQAFAGRDARIRYFRNERNLGAGGNFNRAFELSRGTYFKWCAHDDLISRNFLMETVRALDENADAVIAYPALQGIDSRGAMTSYKEKAQPDMKEMSPASRFRILVAAHGCDAAMFGLWRRSALVQTSLHEPYYGSDCALLAEMALLGNFVRVPNAVLYSRDHPTRSVNLPSSERLLWHNQEASGANAFELSRRLRHLVAIAYRHRRQAPVHHSLYYLLLWMLDPPLIGRFILEGVGFFSPSLRGRLR
ncbi:MAG TPA: glycosyltransferase family 2 protein, partial [Sinorhizobium sp.]|nr:glycosyltransferase family 2 protein [Sinorhizobium sp.]